MKKATLGKRIKYWIDCMMSRGPIAMSMLLFVITTSTVVLIGVAAYLVSDDGGVIYQIWSSLMYTLDAGNLAGVPTDNVFYLLLMFVATLCGLFLTSILIGIVATGVENKLNNLRKGKSTVLENDHTVIIGFDDNVHTIIRELIEANSNKRRKCIVVLGEQPKEDMEDEIASHLSDTKTTKIICRSGGLHDEHAFCKCSVENCKSVIINVDDDAEAVKILLALSSYIENKYLRNPNLRFAVSLRDKQCIEAANIASKGRAAIVFATDAIARIISNTCRQHGLSQVLTEIFSFNGNELYFEKIPHLVGKSFMEATLSFSDAVAIGLYTDGHVFLNPPMDKVIGADDEVVLVEMDDGEFNYHPARINSTTACTEANISATASDNLMILGSNVKLQTILSEYSKYVQDGTRVIIVDDDIDKEAVGTYDNLDILVLTEKVNRALLDKLLNNGANNILLLNDDSQDAESSDSQTLLNLIFLRDIADKTGSPLSITTEMRSCDNQRLATQARVDDFVIGSNFASLMLAQISENPRMIPLIDDLLDENGSELYMKSASDYVKIGTVVNSYTLTEIAARRGEVYLGYRLNGTGTKTVVINPDKNDTIVFEQEDQIVVVAER